MRARFVHIYLPRAVTRSRLRTHIRTTTMPHDHGSACKGLGPNRPLSMTHARMSISGQTQKVALRHGHVQTLSRGRSGSLLRGVGAHAHACAGRAGRVEHDACETKLYFLPPMTIPSRTAPPRTTPTDSSLALRRPRNRPYPLCKPTRV